jgi:hypothetical protein
VGLFRVCQPVNDVWPLYGERGNDATCTAQGFFIQIGMVSILYYISLSVYYFMSIVLTWRGKEFKSKVPYLHAFPLTVGLSLAFAGIPFYGTTLLTCEVQWVPFAKSPLPHLLFKFVPELIAIVACTILMLLVWLKIRRQVTKNTKWQFTGSSLSTDVGKGLTRRLSYSTAKRYKEKSTSTTLQRVEHAVMCQALTYLLALYVSWVSSTILEFKAPKGNMPFAMYCTVLFLGPIKGFPNSINY